MDHIEILEKINELLNNNKQTNKRIKLVDAFTNLLNYVEVNCRPDTISFYKAYFKRSTAFFDKYSIIYLDELNMQNTAKIIADLKLKSLSNTSINKYIMLFKYIVKYNYEIGMLLTVFDYSDIDYKAQNKYPHFNLSVNNEIGNSYFGPSDVESDIAKLVLTDKSTDGYNLNFEVNIIPKNSGERVMNIDFEFTDASGKITVVTKKVKIIVDDDMNVEYSLE